MSKDPRPISNRLSRELNRPLWRGRAITLKPKKPSVKHVTLGMPGGMDAYRLQPGIKLVLPNKSSSAGLFRSLRSPAMATMRQLAESFVLFFSPHLIGTMGFSSPWDTIGKLISDFEDGGAKNAAELENRFNEDLAKLDDGMDVINYIYWAFAAIERSVSARTITLTKDTDLLDLLHNLTSLAKKVIDSDPPRYAPPLKSGKADIFNLFKASGALQLTMKIESKVERLKNNLIALAEIYHTIGKYGCMFYAISNNGETSESVLASALITLLGVKKRFEALGQGQAALAVADDIESIRVNFKLPPDVESWVREYADTNSLSRGAIERTGNFDFLADFLSRKRSPDKEEIKEARKRWKRATKPSLLIELFRRFFHP